MAARVWVALSSSHVARKTRSLVLNYNRLFIPVFATSSFNWTSQVLAPGPYFTGEAFVIPFPSSVQTPPILVHTISPDPRSNSSSSRC